MGASGTNTFEMRNLLALIQRPNIQIVNATPEKESLDFVPSRGAEDGAANGDQTKILHEAEFVKTLHVKTNRKYHMNDNHE